MGDIRAEDLIDLSHGRAAHCAAHLPINATSSWLNEVQSQCRMGNLDPIQIQEDWLQHAPVWFTSSTLNSIQGLDSFPHVEACMGVNHFIDNLLLKHGIDHVQVLEFDYTYYWRLRPNLVPCTLGNLDAAKPLLISMPFAGLFDVHPCMPDILDECADKNIPVHVDSAWLSAARDIYFDYDHPAKNRIGIRWSRQLDATDSISIYNQFHMVPAGLMQVGLHYIHRVPPDHLWKLYEQRYNEICRALYLRPTKYVHVAQSMDRSKLYGLKKLLEQFR